MNIQSQLTKARSELRELQSLPLAELTEDKKARISELQTFVRNLNITILRK